MKFEIPKILWQSEQKDGWIKHISTNTMHAYDINAVDDEYWVCYKDGGFKKFKDLDEAKSWVQNTHYPEQVAKYFEIVS